MSGDISPCDNLRPSSNSGWRYTRRHEETTDDDDLLRRRLVNRLGNDLHYSNDDEVNGVTPRWVTPNSHVAPSMSTDSSMSSSYCVVISDDDEEEEEKEARSGETSSSSARSPPKNESESYEVTDPVVLKDTHWKMLEGGFLCSLCDTTVVHEAQLRDHIKGKRHQKNLNYLEWERYSQSDDSARANDTTIATSTIPAAAADATQRIPTTLRSARSGVIDVVHGNEDPNDQHHIPSDPVSGWLDNVEMDDYTSQCNRQFWTTAGEPRTHGIVDFEGLEGGFYAPAHCVYDAMYCCLCEAKPDGWWKWTEHFKGKKHLKHVSSARSTHIAYWQKLSAGTGLVYYYNHLDGYWCWEDDQMPTIDYLTPWEVLRP